MAILQLRSKRKPTGGRYKRVLIKRLGRLGRLPSFTKLGSTRKRAQRTIGGNTKHRLLSVDKVNLYDPKTKKHSVVEIKAVLENPANRHYVRRNILTKGSIVETTAGKARLTSRPGQNASVNAVAMK